MSELLTPKEVAVALRISRRLVYDLIDDGELPAIMVGKRAWRIRRDSLEQYLTDNAVPAVASGR